MNITINIPENSVDNAVVQGKKITVYFPVQETTIVTVLEKGVLFGIQGAQGIQGVQGDQGIQGIQGLPGIGISSGGSIGQVLVKTSATDYITGWLTLDKTAVGLSNVDNTSDVNKPISTATQTALNGKQATISLTTTGNSGASTFAANVLNIPNYSLIGLGGQPLNANLTSISALTYASTSFVKMTAAGTFALDTNTYLTAESDTLASVTGRGNTTTNAITVGGLTSSGAIVPSSAGAANLGSSSLNWSRVFANRFVSAAGLDLNLSSNGTGTNINFQINDASGNVVGKVFSTGNWVLQNGGTFTDAGFRLDVNGTARIQGEANVSFLSLSGNTAINNSGTTMIVGASGTWTGVRVPKYFETTGSITAASAIARGVYINQTLVAAANNDVLVGLDINPTFTNGAFTGVTRVPFRAYLDSTTNNYIRYHNNGVNYYHSFEIRNDNTTGSGFASIQSQVQSRINYMQVYTGSDYGTFFGVTRGGWAGNISENVSGMAFGTTTAADVIMGANNTATIRIFNATRNVAIQNGGTFTDAGFRLDVVGADSRFNGIRAGLGAGQVAGNTVFGDGALGSNVSGARNTILGYQAGAVLTSSGNTFIGYQAGVAVTSTSNILIGDRAGHTITTGADNTIIGTFSTSLVSGSGNVVLGSAVTLSTASNQNVSIGTFNVSTGDRNTLIGYGVSSGGFNNSVVLGRQAAATANNQFVVGTATTNAGSVTTEVNASTQVWNVIINGTARKILLA